MNYQTPGRPCRGTPCATALQASKDCQKGHDGPEVDCRSEYGGTPCTMQTFEMMHKSMDIAKKVVRGCFSVQARSHCIEQIGRRSGIVDGGFRLQAEVWARDVGSSRTRVLGSRRPFADCSTRGQLPQMCG